MWPNPQFPEEILNGKLHFLCSVQVVSTPLKTVWSVVFSHLNTPRSSIFLGNMYSPVNPLYWNKRTQPLKCVPLNSCFLKGKQNPWKIPVKTVRVHIYITEILLKLKVISFHIFKIQKDLFSRKNVFSELKIRIFLK